MLIINGWRGYRSIEDNYLRQVVNYNQHFVDPITQVHKKQLKEIDLL